MTITFDMFLNKENFNGCYFSICAISFVTVAFVCIFILGYFRIFCGNVCVVVPNNAYVVSD